MRTSFPRDAVREIVAKALGWPESNVIFRDEPEPRIAPKRGQVTGLVRLDLPSIAGVGNDEVRREDVTGGQRETLVGVRVVRLVVRIEAHDAHAADVAENLRMGLQFDDVLEAFRRVDLALADFGPIVPLANPVGSRMVSTVLFELEFNFAVGRQRPGVQGTIDKVASGHPVDPGAAPAVDLEGDFTA